MEDFLAAVVIAAVFGFAVGAAFYLYGSAQVAGVALFAVGGFAGLLFYLNFFINNPPTFLEANGLSLLQSR